MRRKYGNKPQVIDGIRFLSKIEATRYGELKLMEKAGAIRQLEVHPRYPLDVNGQRICTYEADFRYHDSRGTLHVEDTKGVRTALFLLKKKLMKACHGLDVEELTAKKRLEWRNAAEMFDQLDGKV